MNVKSKKAQEPLRKEYHGQISLRFYSPEVWERFLACKKSMETDNAQITLQYLAAKLIEAGLKANGF